MRADDQVNEPVKIGPKGRHLPVPFGWRIVLAGVCKEGDKFANVAASSPYWQAVEEDDIGMPVETFDFLIREM